MEKKFVIGIDLGTTNSAIAFAQIDDSALNELPVTQVVGPATVGELPVLPSSAYILLDEERNEAFSLPWSAGEVPRQVVGAFARQRGALLPDRLVSSAKSWLCYSHVDRKAPILPWGSSLVGDKLSPFEASRLYLEHLRHSLTYHHPGVDIESSHVVLAVPASFDEAARSLTHEAALSAGWGQVTLLEEPQAAFYAWLNQRGDRWREETQPGDLILVCDIGGGTADFSLIAVAERDGVLVLERMSVGDHILLGGDNMDLALAYALRADLEREGAALDQWQFLSLVHALCEAKEQLFGDPSLEEVPISIPGRGSSLFSSTIRTSLKRSLLEAVVLDGFFPRTEITDWPQGGRGIGIQEFGLPFASDPILSKHLARFLARSWENVRSDQALLSLVQANDAVIGEGFLRPTAVLFNGGVFNAGAIRSRVLELLAHWNGGHPVYEIAASGYDTAVARGALYYGTVARQGKGLRIRAGIARSYYLGLEASMPAVPGYRPPLKGLCLVPQGTEEGSELMLSEREFGLVVGEPVTFRFFSSTTRAGDQIGTVVDDAERRLDETSSLEICLTGQHSQPGEIVPVNLHAIVTEMGTLELWFFHVRSGKRWKLEFNVRGSS